VKPKISNKEYNFFKFPPSTFFFAVEFPADVFFWGGKFPCGHFFWGGKMDQKIFLGRGKKTLIYSTNYEFKKKSLLLLQVVVSAIC
jgi:hypothetical protein